MQSYGLEYWQKFTENDLRNAIWSNNNGRQPLPGAIWPSNDEIRAELRRRGLSDRGYHEETTKRELLQRYQELLEEKRMPQLDGVNANSNKSELKNAISCLECPDELLDKYAVVVSLKYPNVYGRIMGNSTEYKRHYFNRLYVFNTARFILE